MLVDTRSTRAASIRPGSRRRRWRGWSARRWRLRQWPRLGAPARCSRWQFDSLLKARVIIEDWRIDHNDHRPHTAHGDLTPTEFAKARPINQPEAAHQLDHQTDPRTSRGYEIVHPLTQEPWGVRRFSIRDPDGNVINIVGHSDD